MATTNRSRRLSAAKLQAQVDAFNERYPVGTPVRFWTFVREGDGAQGETRSQATLLGGHTPVVWVTGHHACIALTHVQPT